MGRLLSAIVVALLMSGAAAAPGLAQDRVALVVGINNYQNLNRLEKATNDARAVAATLQHLGFRVELALDVDRKGFDRAISNFINTITPGAIAYFHYSGHGVSIDNDTYLIPADMELPRSQDREFVKREAVRLSDLIESLKNAKARSRVLVIDACRQNPFAARGVRSIGGSGGIALLPAPEGTLIMYSAADGQTALDGLGPSDREATSVYTRTLLKHLTKPGDTMVEIAREVRREVEDLAKTVGHDQRPSYYDELSDDLRLVPAATGSNAGVAARPPGPPAQSASPAPSAPPGPVATLPPPQRPLGPPAPPAPSVPSPPPPNTSPSGKLGEVLAGVSLPGSTLRRVILPQPDPGMCQAACRADTRCVSWTLVQPATPEQSPRCELKPVIPSQVANTCCTSAIERAPQPEFRQAPPMPPSVIGAMRGFDFPGGDYRGFRGAQTTAEACQATCRAEAQCVAWTYVRPGVVGPDPLCALKSRIPPKVASTCCISGLERQAELNPRSPGPAPGPAPGGSGPLFATNLPGSDYRSFYLRADDPADCAKACKADGQCLAWTYVRPGRQGPRARCWLKNRIPRRVASPCCTSGIERPEAR